MLRNASSLIASFSIFQASLENAETRYQSIGHSARYSIFVRAVPGKLSLVFAEESGSVYQKFEICPQQSFCIQMSKSVKGL